MSGRRRDAALVNFHISMFDRVESKLQTIFKLCISASRRSI